MQKKFIKRLLYPSPLILFLFILFSLLFLIATFSIPALSPVFSYLAYFLSAYALILLSLRAVDIFRFFKRFSKGNKWILRYKQDLPFRMKFSLWICSLWNLSYAVFHLILGIYHASFWFYSIALYALLLFFMRSVLRYRTKKIVPGTNWNKEWKIYRNCGILFLILNLTLTVLLFFMIRKGYTFSHHPITTIALATYTFTTFTVAILRMANGRKKKSPLYSTYNAISLCAACVSMLTLESSMLTVFDEGDSAVSTRLFLSLSGGAVSIFLISLAIFMIIRGTKQQKIKNNTEVQK